MKKRYFKRALSLFLCVIMLFCSTTFASDTDPVLTVMGHNLALLENFSIMYYVDAQNVPANATKGLLIFTKPQAAYTIENAEFNITESTTSYGYDLYYFNDVAAKQITENFYAVPYAMVGDLVYYGEADKYSVLEYCLNKRTSKTLGNDKKTTLGEVVDGILNYGALVQKYLGYNTDRLATATFYTINVDGGLLSDGFTSGLFCENENITMTATSAGLPGVTFEGWYDSADKLVSEDVTATLKCPAKNETFTAKYSYYSAGIEFETNGDGTCSLVGTGEWEGDDLVIPAKAPNGDIVTSIDQSAFAGGTFKTVTIPDTITDIGKKAFDGCANLTDVYYGGSVAKWEDVTILAYNNPLINAEFHSLVSHTVTFTYEDGTVIATQKVYDGEAAIAPIVPEKIGSKEFTGWEGEFDNVVADVTVIAKYEVEYTRVNAEGAVDEAGEYLLFGSYPQSEVTDIDIKEALTQKAGSTDTWTSYNYYIGNEVSEFMKYTDVEYQGEKYRGVYFTQYRPWHTDEIESSSDYGLQNDNGYYTNTIYWFKYEPIKWKILTESNYDAFIVSDMLLDSQHYHTSSSNYENAHIRSWLNSTFYNTAFNSIEQGKIKTTKVDNSVASTGDSSNTYACEDTNDKIFLLSYKEATDSSYGFSSETLDDTARVKNLTAYAKAQGAHSSSGIGVWRLRSLPSIIDFHGNVSGGSPSSTRYGVAPALHLSLSSVEQNHKTEPEKMPESFYDNGGYLYSVAMDHTADGSFKNMGGSDGIADKTQFQATDSDIYLQGFVSFVDHDGYVKNPGISGVGFYVQDTDEYVWVDDVDFFPADELETDSWALYGSDIIRSLDATCYSLNINTSIFPEGAHDVNLVIEYDGKIMLIGERTADYGGGCFVFKITSSGENYYQSYYTREGDSIYFGSYPQSEVTDVDITTALTKAAGNTETWISYDYYVLNRVYDYMKYIDIEYGGEKYRGVYFTNYRPLATNLSSSSDNAIQDDNGYNTNTIYWFKYEPIKWQVLRESNGDAFLFSELLLDAQEYTPSTTTPNEFGNRYELSRIRSWLNDEFYATAFNSYERSRIRTTLVDNTPKSTGYYGSRYACPNTNDKVFLLSYAEATNTYCSPIMVKNPTAYAKSQGASVSPTGSGWWWLRSPDDSISGERNVRVIYNDGHIDYNCHFGTNYCVAPALHLKLENYTKYYTQEGDSIYFGSYPQSEVTDVDVKTALTREAGIPETWTSYEYYIEGEVSDFMKYKDVTYNGNKYRGVYFTEYRPYGTVQGTDTSNQDEYGYNLFTPYWFKYEPIKWKVLEETFDDIFLVADMVIDSQDYDGDNLSNNYENSSIRNWLNETFYNTAFNDTEQVNIKTTKVDNSAASTAYSSNPNICDDTNDKIFLLSYNEVTNSIYHMSSESSRKKDMTAYSRAQGGFSNVWILRSPCNADNIFVNEVQNGRAEVNTQGPVIGIFGVVPALHLNK